MVKEVLSLLKEAKRSIKEHKEDNSLVSNCFFLKNGNILALRNPYGDSRCPYSIDGLTMWIYASGNISINQSNFFVIPPTVEGKEPYINFFGGIKNKKGTYDVFSLTGNADTELGTRQETYTIFSKSHCYFIRIINKVVFAIKATITDDKRIIFNTCAYNPNKKDIETFISFYFNPLLIHSSVEDEETKWFRTIKLEPYGAIFTSVEDLSREVHLHNYAVLKCAHNGDRQDICTRRMDYVGDKNYSVSQSSNLKRGSFTTHLPSASFVDMAVFGDIIIKSLKPGQSLNSNYQIRIALDEKELEVLKKEAYGLSSNDKLFELNKKNRQNTLKIRFDKLNDYPLNNNLLNNFLDSVIEQVHYASLTKNSSLMLLGIRDVYQMLEVSLLWDKENAKKKILESLSFLDPSGRAPRQYAKETKGSDPLMDNREFIDQGQWIITTIYKYLAFTNDYSLLKEQCGYCELIGRKGGHKLEQVDTVYDHLIKIINYLISNIDESNNCLHALYGDWNDAVDGLGTSNDETKKFGNGVSVMATCHLYQNLHEMEEIRKIAKDNNDPKYLDIAKRIEQGLLDNAIVSNSKEKRIVHGWGMDKSFYVGRFKDVDGKSRHSATSNAFFVMSGLYNKHPELKSTIMEAEKALDSKYGLMTFDQYFDKKDAYQVGRIVNLPRGTAENAATYIHAGMFFVRALFQMNEGKEAFNQLYKLIPITHERISTSPYVMPNSYGYNPDLGIDGESMGDWYTGSSNTLLKAIIFDMFGINPLIGDELRISPSNYFPSDKAELSLTIKGKKVKVTYLNKHSKERKIYVNGEVLTTNVNLKSYKGLINIEIID